MPTNKMAPTNEMMSATRPNSSRTAAPKATKMMARSTTANKGKTPAISAALIGHAVSVTKPPVYAAINRDAMSPASKRLSIREEFLAKRNELECDSCNVTGTLVMNGSTGSRIMVKCSVCLKKITGAVLEEKMSKCVLPEVVYDETGELDTEEESAENNASVTSNPPVLRPQTLEFEENSFLAQKNNEIAELKEIIKDQGATIRELMTQVGKLTDKVTELISARAKEKETGTGRTYIEKASQPKAGHLNQGQSTAAQAPERSKGDQEAQKDGKTKAPAQRTWADVARIPERKFEESRKALETAGFKAVPKPQRTGTQDVQPNRAPVQIKPVPIAVYFGGVPRGPIGALRRALLLALPNWAALHLSFIGNTALEVLCHKPLVPRLVAVMKAHSFRHLELFDPAKSIAGGEARLKANRQACLRRWAFNAENTRSPAAEAWYKEQADILLKLDPTLTVEKVQLKTTVVETPDGTVAVPTEKNTGTKEQQAGAQKQGPVATRNRNDDEKPASQSSSSSGAQSESAQASETTEDSISAEGPGGTRQ